MKGKREMRLKISGIACRLALMTAFVVVMGLASYGQSNVEVTGHLGLIGGIGSHGSFGGSLGVPVTDRLSLSGDLSYIPFGGSSVTVGGATASSSARAINFNGSLLYQFKPSRSSVPYAGAGLGFLRTSFSSSSSGFGTGSLEASGNSTDLYFNVGGGLRYYVRERWGFKPEFMIFAGSNTYVRLSGGMFFQFGE
jgi:Outer membrane protein beta-barrel domain